MSGDAGLRQALTALADSWLARIPHQSGVFYPEAHAYDDGKDTATDACADSLRELLAAHPAPDEIECDATVSWGRCGVMASIDAALNPVRAT